MLTLIVAMGQNHAIGKNNKLLWHLPDDFKRFKRLTMGFPIIMGRKTFDSLPGVLPGRRHIVVSRQSGLLLPKQVEVVPSIAAAITLLNEQTAFVIGGGQLYAQTIHLADTIELTRVQTSPEADTFFPEINLKEWELVSKEYHPADQRHAYEFYFEKYIRKREVL